MKKILLIILAITLFAGIGFCFAPKKDLHPSDYKIGLSYDDAIKVNKPIIAMFYVDWCTYCKNFMPKLRIINSIYKNQYNVVMINCEDPQNKKVIDDYQITSYPTIYIIDYSKNMRIHLDNGNYGDLGFLKREFDRYLKFKV